MQIISLDERRGIEVGTVIVHNRVDAVGEGQVDGPLGGHKEVVGDVGNLFAFQFSRKLGNACVELRLNLVGVGRHGVVVVDIAHVGGLGTDVIHHEVVVAGIGNEVSVEVVAALVAPRVLQERLGHLGSRLLVVERDTHHAGFLVVGAHEGVVIELIGGVLDGVVDVNTHIVGVSHLNQRTMPATLEQQEQERQSAEQVTEVQLHGRPPSRLTVKRWSKGHTSDTSRRVGPI